MALCTGLPVLPVPHHRGFALVGDADGRQIVRAQAALLHRFGDHFLGAAPDFFGIVLHPSRLGIDLLVFLLCEARRSRPGRSNTMKRVLVVP